MGSFSTNAPSQLLNALLVTYTKNEINVSTVFNGSLFPLAVKPKTMLQCARGMPDRFGVAAQSRQVVVDKLRAAVERASFEQVQTPLMEPSTLYNRTLGQGSDIVQKEMYTLLDRSGNSMTLRPEGTAGVVRAILSAGTQYKLPQKLWYEGCMFRYERPQRGRFREFRQFGIEMIGSEGYMADVEAINLANVALKNYLGIQDTDLLINTLGSNDSRKSYQQALTSYYHSCLKDLSLDSQRRLERGNALRVLDSKDAKDKMINAEAPKLVKYLSKECLKRFHAVQEALETLGISYKVDDCLVRGLDYYSHTVFEFTESSDVASPNAVLAGGRYSDLFQELGSRESVDCVGWAAGVDRLSSMISRLVDEKLKIAVIPVMSDSNLQFRAFKVASELMMNQDNHQWNVHYCHTLSMKKGLKQANALGCKIGIFIGPDELQKNTASVKLLDSREQFSVKLDDLASFLSTKVL